MSLEAASEIVFLFLHVHAMCSPHIISFSTFAGIPLQQQPSLVLQCCVTVTCANIASLTTLKMQYLNYGKCRNLVFFLSPENPRKKCQNICVNLAYVYGLFLQFITLRASCGTVYCNWSCLFVGECVCLSVCYHDNSKLRASIFTKLGLWVKVVTISS